MLVLFMPPILVRYVNECSSLHRGGGTQSSNDC